MTSLFYGMIRKMCIIFGKKINNIIDGRKIKYVSMARTSSLVTIKIKVKKT